MQNRSSSHSRLKPKELVGDRPLLLLLRHRCRHHPRGCVRLLLHLLTSDFFDPEVQQQSNPVRLRTGTLGPVPPV
jgi:hypothetical protein